MSRLRGWHNKVRLANVDILFNIIYIISKNDEFNNQAKSSILASYNIPSNSSSSKSLDLASD